MGFINFFVTKLSTDVGATDTTITLDTMPLYADGSPVTSGRLVLEARNVSQREIIKFTGVAGQTITGVSRGQGGTTARTHTAASVVEMNLTAQDLEDAINVPNDIISRFDDVVEDYVNNGLVVSQTSLLVGKTTLGVAYISGYRVNKTADTTGQTYAASKDTYVDIDSSGNFYLNDVPLGTAQPAMVANRIRLARVTTDATTITAVYNFDNRPSRLTGYNILREDDNDYLVPNTVTYKGNRSYELVFNGVDYTQRFSEGMRLRMMRSVPAPVRSLLLNGTTQFMSRPSAASLGTFTDDFAVGGWIKLTSYPSVQAILASRFNGTSGWALDIDSTGVLRFIGYNGGAANYSLVRSTQAIPLNKWVYVTAQLDMSAFTGTTTTSYIMLDCVDVPVLVQRSGTNPTAIVQAGNLEVGSSNGGNGFFPGQMAQMWYSSAKVPQANVPALASQGLTSALIATNNIISAFSFDNTPNDLNVSSGNNLTAQAAAGYTLDSPFAGGSRSYDAALGLIEYGLVATKAIFSTNTTLTVQVPEGHALPTTGGIAAVKTAGDGKPFGFPISPSRWSIEAQMRANITQAAPVTNTWYNIAGMRLLIPVGSWMTQNKGSLYSDRSGAGPIGANISLSKSASSEDEKLTGLNAYQGNDTGFILPYEITHPVENAVATTYYKISRTTQTSGANIQDAAGDATSLIRAYPNFL